jgi:hypothetical protein
MKLISILSAGLFAAMAALSVGVQAASDTEKAAEAKVPVASEQTGKKMKPHSHMEEKTGVSPQASSVGATDDKSDKPKASKPKIDKDRSKHFHPRDGKS